MTEALLAAGLGLALGAVGVLVWLVHWLIREIASRQATIAELLSRLGSRDYEHFAAVQRFVEPWNEDDLHPKEPDDGSRVVFDPTGLIDATSPPIP